jgi:hypothetical protein
MKPISDLDLKRARLVPAAMFCSPHAVVRSRALSITQKIEILRRWEFDARRVGDPDGRPGTRHDLVLLAEVRAALAKLDAHLRRAERRKSVASMFGFLPGRTPAEVDVAPVA